MNTMPTAVKNAADALSPRKRRHYFNAWNLLAAVCIFVGLWIAYWQYCTKAIRLISDEDSAICMAMSPDGRLYAVGGSNGLIVVRDSNTGAHVATLKESSPYVSALAFSPTGKMLASTPGGLVRLWDTETWSEIGVLAERNHFMPERLCFSHDGRFLAWSDSCGLVDVWDVQTRSRRQLVGVRTDMESPCAFSPKEPVLAYVEQVYTPFTPPGKNGVNSVIKLWDARTGFVRETPMRHKGGVQSLAFSPSGTKLVAGGDTLTVWDFKSESKRTEFGHGGNDLAFSPDERLIAVGTGQTRYPYPAVFVGSLHIWDWALSEKQAKYRWFWGPVRSLAFTPDGSEVLTAGEWPGYVKACKVPPH